jgi:hypothetical protein
MALRNALRGVLEWQSIGTGITRNSGAYQDALRISGWIKNGKGVARQQGLAYICERAAISGAGYEDEVGSKTARGD